MSFLAEWYVWTKTLHIVSVVAWMAGMMYLPRLYIYHCDAEPGSKQSETFKVMERKLLRGIINPAMFAVFIFGGLLLMTPGVIDWSSGWIWAKLGFVLVLGAIHGLFSRWRKDFEADRNTRPAKFYRIVNEIPFVLMVAIVVMVIVRPF